MFFQSSSRLGLLRKSKHNIVEGIYNITNLHYSRLLCTVQRIHCSKNLQKIQYYTEF